MPYFQVDDQFHSHPKTAWLSAGAVALWVRAGSHCAAYLTDGFIDEDTVKRLGGRGASIQELLTIRAPHTSPLWFKVDGGYQFHDWDQYQPTSVEVKENRRKARERMKAVRANRGRTFEGSSPDVRVAQSNPIQSIPVKRLIPISPVPEREAGIDVDRVIAAVQKHCGRDCTTPGAFLIIGTVMDRAKTKPKNKTAFVVKAIENDPFVWQKMLDETAVA